MVTATTVPGIPVHPTLLDRWRQWLMPDTQPFLVPRDIAVDLGLADEPGRLTFEVKDSFCLYDVGSAALCWLTRTESRRLSAEVRRAQPSAHRWPTTDVRRDIEVVIRFVETGRRASRHAEVAESTWRRALTVLPAARPLAGTFPDSSGPNCFGTVMAAAGVVGADTTWMQREPFEDWLDAATRPGGDDEDAGTVLVWRDGHRQVQHAAVTLGDGWALHKPSQGWMSPAKVLTVREVILSSRRAGCHLARHRIDL